MMRREGNGWNLLMSGHGFCFSLLSCETLTHAMLSKQAWCDCRGIGRSIDRFSTSAVFLAIGLEIQSLATRWEKKLWRVFLLWFWATSCFSFLFLLFFLMSMIVKIPLFPFPLIRILGWILRDPKWWKEAGGFR